MYLMFYKYRHDSSTTIRNVTCQSSTKQTDVFIYLRTHKTEIHLSHTFIWSKTSKHIKTFISRKIIFFLKSRLEKYADNVMAEQTLTLPPMEIAVAMKLISPSEIFHSFSSWCCSATNASPAQDITTNLC